MKRSQGTRKASKLASEDLDIISRMPDNVVTHILDRLPLQYVMRTSTLSRNWRFKWTMLSQLVFDEKFYEFLSDKDGENKFGRVISMFLLHVKGDITKFVLYIDGSSYYNRAVVEDISLWILFLSKNGVKDLTLDKRNPISLKLSAHLFSCLELKHLKLVSCDFNPPAGFHGFPNLLSLDLRYVEFQSGKFGEFFTPCPVLEILNLGCPFTGGRVVYSEGKVKLVEIANLVNLKMLFLSLRNLDNTLITSTIFELVGSLPKLQQLHLDFHKCKFTEDGTKKALPATLPCLKTLKLSTIDLGDKSILSCAFEMIKSFPNLQALEITTSNWDTVSSSETCSLEVDHETMGLLQLRRVVFTYCKASENEICLLKYLLGRSPFLKRIVIKPYSRLCHEDKFNFSRKLVKLHRASPVVDIDLS